MYEELKQLLRSFLDEKGRLIQYPAKHKKKNYALLYLAEKFDKNRIYSEAEVNELLNEYHTFHDPATLRRELFCSSILCRTADCTEYHLSLSLPKLEELEQLSVKEMR